MAKAKEPIMTIGEMIDRAFDLREERKGIEAEAAKLKGQQDELEEKILAELDRQGVESTTAKYCQAVVTNSVVPVVKDWGKFHNWIIKHKATYMLERRPAAGPYREMLEAGQKSPPGVEPFNKRGISLRKAS